MFDRALAWFINQWSAFVASLAASSTGPLVNFVTMVAAIALAIFALYQALISRKTARQRLRAYAAKPYRAFNIDESGTPAQVYTTITNVGATFAHKVERSVGVSIRSGPVPKRFEDLGTLIPEEGALR